MAHVNLAEAKALLSELVARAEAGESRQISRRGKPVALLSGLTPPRKPLDVAAMRARRGTLLIRYLDTSLLVSSLTEQAASDRVLSWLTRHVSTDPRISDWVVTEFASALSVKIRMGRLSAENRTKASSLFTRLQGDSIAVAPITREHVQAAARFANQFGPGLQAGDALHVAATTEPGATICTLDKRLSEVAVALGVSAELV